MQEVQVGVEPSSHAKPQIQLLNPFLCFTHLTYGCGVSGPGISVGIGVLALIHPQLQHWLNGFGITGAGSMGVIGTNTYLTQCAPGLVLILSGTGGDKSERGHDEADYT